MSARRFDVMRERQVRLARGRQRRRYWLVLLVVVQVAIVVAFVAFNRQCEELIASLSSATGGGAAAGDSPGDTPGDTGGIASVVAVVSAAVLASAYGLYEELQARKKPVEPVEPAWPAGPKKPGRPEARPEGSTALVPATSLEGRLKDFLVREKNALALTPRNVESVKVTPNAGAGECLFFSVIEALREAKKGEYTVEQLRDIVAESMTGAQLRTLKFAREAFPREQTYAFMKGVESVDKLKEAVKGKAYWGDEMALTAFSKKFGLRIEVLLLNQQNKIEKGVQVNERDEETKKLKEGFVVLLQNEHYEVLKINDKYIHEVRPEEGPAIAA